MTDIVVKTGLVDHAAFERLLVSSLPDLAAEIDDEERSLLHMEMSAVARATCRAIENGDENSIRRHFEFIDSVLSNAASDVENAVHVSYLENIFLDEERAAFLRARSTLPDRLSAARSDLEAHWRLLGNGVRRHLTAPLRNGGAEHPSAFRCLLLARLRNLHNWN
jgi:hypothetical protein